MEKKYFGVMVDCSRNAVLHIEGVKRLIDYLQKIGYNMLMLYTEDTYEVDGQPLFGYLRGRYSKKELKEIVAYGEAHDVELVPCIQTLAHLNQLFKWDAYKDVNDCDDILLVGEEKTYALIDNMICTLRECFHSELIHVGMDEAHNLGNGNYKKLHGVQDHFQILKNHLDRVTAIVEKYQFKPIIWSDMFFSLATKDAFYYIENPEIITPEIANIVPEGLSLTYWDYYADDKSRYDNMLSAHLHFNNPIWFAGGAWTWAGFTPHNRVSIDRTRKAMQSCRENNINNIFLTCWGDNGGESTVFSVLPTLFYAAEIYRGNEDDAAIQKKFEELFGIRFDDFMMLDLPAAPSAEFFKRCDSIDVSLLYADPFLGWMDPTIKKNLPDSEETYEKYAAMLKPLENHETFGYQYRAASALCSLLAVKSTLGIRTREAYGSGDHKALEQVVRKYKTAEERVEAFYDAYRVAWYHDKKGSGFEVQDIRLGGLIRRLANCRARLEAYLAGELIAIDELEEKQVDVSFTYWPRWSGSSSVNNIGM